MAAKAAAKKVIKRRRERKNVEKGAAHIRSSFNNTMVTITDLEGNPYVVPMNFAYRDGIIYLHSGPEGSKVTMAERHPRVCITFCEGHELVYMHRQVACSYSMKSRSVICHGNVRFIEDMDEKREVLDIIMRQYTSDEFKYSEPAVRNVKVWEVKIGKMTCRSFGLRPSEVTSE